MTLIRLRATAYFCLFFALLPLVPQSFAQPGSPRHHGLRSAEGGGSGRGYGESSLPEPGSPLLEVRTFRAVLSSTRDALNDSLLNTCARRAVARGRLVCCMLRRCCTRCERSEPKSRGTVFGVALALGMVKTTGFAAENP